MTFTQPICAPCWNEQHPERPPVQIRNDEAEWERCAFCGYLTHAGIYTRVDPATVPYPSEEK